MEFKTRERGIELVHPEKIVIEVREKSRGAIELLEFEFYDQALMIRFSDQRWKVSLSHSFRMPVNPREFETSYIGEAKDNSRILGITLVVNCGLHPPEFEFRINQVDRSKESRTFLISHWQQDHLLELFNYSMQLSHQTIDMDHQMLRNR